MGNRDLLEVLYLASEGDGDPSPTRVYRFDFDSRNTGERRIPGRRRAWFFIGLVAAAVMTAVALGPKVPPLGSPQMVAGTIDGTVEPLNEPAIYQPCRTMASLHWFGGCGLRPVGSN